MSPDLIVYADESQNAVTVRLWAPLDRDGSRPPVIDVEARCGNLGTVSTVTLPTGPTKQLAHNLAELLALANGGD